MTGEELEKYEAAKEAINAPKKEKFVDRVKNGWLFSEWTLCVSMWVIMFVAGMTIERMYTNPTLRDLKIVERACGYENVAVRTVHELGIATAIFSCERVAQ